MLLNGDIAHILSLQNTQFSTFCITFHIFEMNADRD